MDTHYVLQLLSVNESSRPVAASTSPFFSVIPKEVRLLIYEFLFSSFSYSDTQFSLIKSSDNLEPLLTCRHLYREARLLAFRNTLHILNWHHPSSCIRRLLALEPDQCASIRHVAISTPAAHLYEKLQPLRFHLDRTRAPVIALDSLTIFLEYPEFAKSSQEQRIRELNMVFSSIWYYKSVKRVIVLNVPYKEDLRRYPGHPGLWSWMPDPDAVGTEDLLWRVELTDFYDYQWKPWTASAKSLE